MWNVDTSDTRVDTIFGRVDKAFLFYVYKIEMKLSVADK